MQETKIEQVGDGERRAPVKDGPDAAGGRPTSAVVRELVLESSALLHAEVALARSELKQNMAGLAAAAAAAATGAALLAAGALALLTAAIVALALVWPLWLAALVVGSGLSIVGATILGGGLSRAHPGQRLKPTRTRDSIRRIPEVVPHKRKGQR